VSADVVGAQNASRRQDEKPLRRDVVGFEIGHPSSPRQAGISAAAGDTKITIASLKPDRALRASKGTCFVTHLGLMSCTGGLVIPPPPPPPGMFRRPSIVITPPASSFPLDSSSPAGIQATATNLPFHSLSRRRFPLLSSSFHLQKEQKVPSSPG
jgi:hypothetical protein